jgi:hypothetical protein
MTLRSTNYSGSGKELRIGPTLPGSNFEIPLGERWAPIAEMGGWKISRTKDEVQGEWPGEYESTGDALAVWEFETRRLNHIEPHV